MLISPGTGLIGYPTYTAQVIVIRTLFNSSIKAGIAVTVQSSLDPANGSWQVFGLVHHLESFVPNGQWMTQFIGRLEKRP